MSSELKRTVIWLFVFSIAMGFLETAIVVYLRALYYPNGFMFPLSIMDPQIGVIEIVREAATIIMLSTVGILAGRSTNQRFAFFLATFAIWDIFYYVFLKVFLGWPESFLTWDILFLIPVPWIGPVLAPCMISTTMLILAVVLVYRDAQNTSYRLSLLEWIFLFVGSFVVVASWTMDFLSYNVDSATTNSNTSAIATYIPLSYNWYLFCIGEVLLLIATYLFWKRTSKTRISS